MTEEDTVATELEVAQQDAWVAQTMIAAILDTVGAVEITKESAGKDFSDKGIEITESEDGSTLLLTLKDNE